MSEESASTRWAAGIFSLWILVALCVGIEGVLTLADYGLIELRNLRMRVYDYAGIWSGLLGLWESNHPAYPNSMFLTCGFLHNGPSHMIVNMLTLWTAGEIVIDCVGSKGFLRLYAASIVGGHRLRPSGAYPDASVALFGSSVVCGLGTTLTAIL